MQPTIEQAAALAWDLVKADTDPPFSHCLLDHQQKLIYHAQDVQRGGPADDGFERKVKEVLAHPERAIADIKAKLGLPETLPYPNAEEDRLTTILMDGPVNSARPLIGTLETGDDGTVVYKIAKHVGPLGAEPLPDAPPTKPLARPAKAKKKEK